VTALNDPAQLLAAYDTQLRADSETAGAISVTRLGPLHLATFTDGRGFITYQDLGGAGAQVLRGLVSAAITHFRQTPGISAVEWKTRGHDHAPGLHEALLENGFTAGEQESIMIGEARALAVDVPLPKGVSLRQVTEEDDVRAASALVAEVFGRPTSDAMADHLLHRLSLDAGTELWVAETTDAQTQRLIVSTGRLEPVHGTAFAGIWGGATRQDWRGRGIYRALTAARARSALALGKALINSDSTEYSRPILERSGLVKVSTTTPYTWQR
jgi:hypothetical protein